MRFNYYSLDKNLYLYKNHNLFFSNAENDKKQKGRLIFFLANNLNDIYKEVNSNLFIKEYIRGYYIPKLDRLSSCRNKRIENIQEIRYKELETKLPNLTFKRLKLDLYSNYNVFFDSYPYWKVFEETYKSNKTFESKIR